MSKKHQFNVAFFIKRTRMLSNGEAPIYMRITIDGTRADMGIGRSVVLQEWDTVGGKVNSKTKESKNLSKYIESLRYQVSNLFYEIESQYDDLNALLLRQIFLGGDPEEKTLLSIHTEYNEKVEKLIGIDYRKSTHVRYKTSYKHLENFIKTFYSKSDISIKKVDHTFVTEYDSYLKIKGKLTHNSAIKYHKNLKKLLAHSRANQWISHDPYANYKLSVKKTDRGYLDDKELGRLIKHEFSIERLSVVRDCFLVSCFTGLAYADLERLTKNNLSEHKDGSLWIKINRLKTDITSSVPVLKIVHDIIERYQYHPVCVEKGKLLPVSSNQKMNNYLKEIAVSCNIEQDLSTHLARHTFATTVTLNNDVPIESVSKMLGHTSLKTTKIYARLLDKKVGQDMSKLNTIYA